MSDKKGWKGTGLEYKFPRSGPNVHLLQLFLFFFFFFFSFHRYFDRRPSRNTCEDQHSKASAQEKIILYLHSIYVRPRYYRLPPLSHTSSLFLRRDSNDLTSLGQQLHDDLSTRRYFYNLRTISSSQQRYVTSNNRQHVLLSYLQDVVRAQAQGPASLHPEEAKVSCVHMALFGNQSVANTS